MIIFCLWALGALCWLGSKTAEARGGKAAAAPWQLAMAVIYTALIPLSAIRGDWPGVVIAGFVAVSSWLLWWFGRGGGRRRRRSLKALGHKARARLAALARDMPRPGPVLRPAPQGAAS